jgi:hypothetical protein
MNRESRIAERVAFNIVPFQKGIWACLSDMLENFNPKVECEITGHVEANNDEGKILEVWAIKNLKTIGVIELRLTDIQGLLFKRLKLQEAELVYTPKFKDVLNEQLKDYEWMETDVEVEVSPDRSAFKMGFYPLGVENFKDRYEMPYKVTMTADKVRFELEKGKKMEDAFDEIIEKKLVEVRHG